MMQNSSKIIQWNYGNSSPTNQANLSQITNWWRSLHGKSVELRSITGIETNPQGNWQPNQEDPIQTVQIENPDIVNNSLRSDRFSKTSTIQTVALDFDPIQNQLVVHLPPIPVIQNPNRQPNIVLRQNPEKYIFTQCF